jgi:hypothetical protein
MKICPDLGFGINHPGSAALNYECCIIYFDRKDTKEFG